MNKKTLTFSIDDQTMEDLIKVSNHMDLHPTYVVEQALKLFLEVSFEEQPVSE